VTFRAAAQVSMAFGTRGGSRGRGSRVPGLSPPWLFWSLFAPPEELATSWKPTLWLTRLRRHVSTLRFEALYQDPIPLLSPRRFGPLLEIRRVFQFDALPCQPRRESGGEEAKCVQVVDAHPSSIRQPFEIRNILINVALFHLQLSQLDLGFFVGSIAHERMAEIMFQRLPGVHPVREECRVGLDCVEPFVLSFSPPFGFQSLDQRREVHRPFDGVVRH
jgi:hypothetical protein